MYMPFSCGLDVKEGKSGWTDGCWESLTVKLGCLGGEFGAHLVRQPEPALYLKASH